MYTKVSDLENIVVAPGPVLLKDVATVFFDLKDETTYSRVNGKEAVSVVLINDSQANLIELSHRVSDAIDKLNEKIVPLDLEIVVQRIRLKRWRITSIKSLTWHWSVDCWLFSFSGFFEKYAAGVLYRTFNSDLSLYGLQFLLCFRHYYQ